MNSPQEYAFKSRYEKMSWRFFIANSRIDEIDRRLRTLPVKVPAQ